jgi:hypothetical protein
MMSPEDVERVIDTAENGGRVIDLMDALKKSLAAAQAAGEKINLTDFVRDSFDSILADVIPPKTSRDALAMIEHLLAQRFGRRLNQSEQVKVGIAVTCEWNARHRPYGVRMAEDGR